MKKILLTFSIVLLTLFASCKRNNPDPEPQPQPNPDDTTSLNLTITPGNLLQTSIEFTLKCDNALFYGYSVAKASDAPAVPKPEELINSNFSEFPGNFQQTVSVKDLTPATEYLIYAVASNSKNYSKVETLKVSTSEAGMITLMEIGDTYFKFAINGEGKSYKFSVVDSTMYHMYAESPESWLSNFGFPESGYKEFEWSNGQYYNDTKMEVYPSHPYYIMVQDVNSSTAEFIKFKTKEGSTTDALVDVEVYDITSTTCRVKCTPDHKVKQYHVYVNTAEWYDYAHSLGADDAMIAQIIMLPEGGRKFTGPSDELYGPGKGPGHDIKTDTDSRVYIAVVGEDDGVSLLMKDFRTAPSSGKKSEVTVTVEHRFGQEDRAVDINVKADDLAYQAIRYVMTLAEYKTSGKSDAELVSLYGTQFNDMEFPDIKTPNGIWFGVEDLYRETDYVCVVGVRTLEGEETYVAKQFKTEKRPDVSQVTSTLFEDLLGTWNVSYTAYVRNEYGDQVTATFTNEPVVISQGFDDLSKEEYRAINRLVVEGFPFYKAANFKMVTPAELMASDPSYWGEYPSLAYRDCGPKIFLEIGSSDQISVPTSRNEYLLNYTENGAFYFVGCNYDSYALAPASFPVELSADKNTMTIKASVPVAEYDNLSYRPAVFLLNGNADVMIAQTDIVLTRVK